MGGYTFSYQVELWDPGKFNFFRLIIDVSMFINRGISRIGRGTQYGKQP